MIKKGLKPALIQIIVIHNEESYESFIQNPNILTVEQYADESVGSTKFKPILVDLFSTLKRFASLAELDANTNQARLVFSLNSVRSYNDFHDLLVGIRIEFSNNLNCIAEGFKQKLFQNETEEDQVILLNEVLEHLRPDIDLTQFQWGRLSSNCISLIDVKNAIKQHNIHIEQLTYNIHIYENIFYSLITES